MFKDEDDELTRQQKIFQANSESYNGAIRDNYSWCQDILEVDVTVPLPDHVKTASQCRVTITKTHLKVSVRSPSNGGFETLVDGELSKEVKYSRLSLLRYRWDMIKVSI